MTSSDKSINYDLVFQVHHDGSVTVESFHLPSTKPMPGQHCDKDNKININVRGPGKTPLAMKTVEIDFTGGRMKGCRLSAMQTMRNSCGARASSTRTSCLAVASGITRQH